MWSLQINSFNSDSLINNINVTQNGSSSGLVSRCCRASSCRPSYLVSVGEVESGTRPSRLGVCQFCEVPSRPTLTLITLSGSQSDNGEGKKKKKESARVGCEASLCRAPARSRSHVSCQSCRHDYALLVGRVKGVLR